MDIGINSYSTLTADHITGWSWNWTADWIWGVSGYI